MDLAKIEQFIVENELLQGGEKVIVGVSGGADSVALLDILHAFKIDCVVAHCNFHLRGEESNRDAFFVEELCQKYNLKFERIDFDTEVHAKLNSISIEMAARELRYNWFEELRKIHLADKIVVAHHQDDSVETILLNLTRGTGIKGLTGISPVNGYIIRPLLCLKRTEILEYLEERKLRYVNDSTNSEDLYTRNKIRLNILPLLEEINPSAKDAILRTADNLKQVSNIYRMYISQVTKEIFKNDKISIPLLVQYLEPEALLYEILSPHGFNPTTIKQIFLSLISQSGKIFHSDTHELLKDREYLILKKKERITIDSFNIHEEDDKLTYPIRLKTEKIFLSGNFSIEKNPAILYVDAEKINYPLTLRRWKKGDWFIPFGMKGKKKISDYFTDHKFSIYNKESAWLLCSNEDIMWLVGHRSDDRFKIDDNTKEVIKITLLDDDK